MILSGGLVGQDKTDFCLEITFPLQDGNF